MARCDSFYPHDEIVYQCALPGHEAAGEHIALTRTVIRGRQGFEERWGLLVWSTEMAEKGFDR